VGVPGEEAYPEGTLTAMREREGARKVWRMP
jgi:hypothetical protein